LPSIESDNIFWLSEPQMNVRIPSWLRFGEVVLLVGVDVKEEVVLRWHRQQLHLGYSAFVRRHEWQAVVVEPEVVVMTARVALVHVRSAAVERLVRRVGVVIVVGVVVMGVVVVEDVVSVVVVVGHFVGVVVLGDFRRRHL